jgi:hypothetical protein
MAQQPAYAGTWLLLPELCLYDEGDPPTSGVYTLAWSSSGIEISIAWQAADGQSHSISFGGPGDGSLQPTGNDVPSHLSITHIDASTLDSSAFDGTTEIAYARRRVSGDRRLLVTVQTGVRSDGTRFRSFQVYEREDDGQSAA